MILASSRLGLRASLISVSLGQSKQMRVRIYLSVVQLRARNRITNGMLSRIKGIVQ